MRYEKASPKRLAFFFAIVTFFVTVAENCPNLCLVIPYPMD
jgi:hypothetical protein